MNILALDLGTKTGYAIGQTNKGSTVIESGTKSFQPRKGDIEAARFLWFEDWLRATIDAHNTHEIHYEKVNPATFQSKRAAECWIGFSTVLLVTAAKHGVPVIPWGVGSIKKQFTGNGRASKEQMIEEAKRRNYAPKDDNEADAIAIWEIVRQQIGRQS